jgi:hypothetical protein
MFTPNRKLVTMDSTVGTSQVSILSQLSCEEISTFQSPREGKFFIGGGCE